MPDVADVMAEPIAQQLLREVPILHLAYTGLDGGPRMNGVPPRVLFARGRAALAVVDGVPAGYLDASHRTLPREQWDGFDTQVRGLYDQMVAITVTLDWVKLIDFETTVPIALERLLGERQARG
jgi:hypothetical protein